MLFKHASPSRDSRVRCQHLVSPVHRPSGTDLNPFIQSCQGLLSEDTGPRSTAAHDCLRVSCYRVFPPRSMDHRGMSLDQPSFSPCRAAGGKRRRSVLEAPEGP